MSNIYLKVTIEKKWRTQNFDFLSLKSLFLGQFLGYPTHADIIEFSIFLLQLKNQKSESKIVCGFSITYFGKNYGVLKLESPCFLLSKNITLIKTRRNRKWKIPQTVLERWTMCFSSYQNRKLKEKLWWVEARKGKKNAFFVTFILSQGFFFTFVFYLSL